MATVEDIRARKKIRSEFTKRMIDITNLDLQVIHSVVYLRGVVRPIKGGPQDLKSELELISRIIINSGLAKDVIVGCTIRGG